MLNDGHHQSGGVVERTFRGIHVTDDRITYRDSDHPLLGARASVKSPAALRRDVGAGRIQLSDATIDMVENRKSANAVFLVVAGEDFSMAVPVPIRKGSDARTFASRLNTAANRLALSSPATPVSQVSTMAERFTVTAPSLMGGNQPTKSSGSKYATMETAPSASSSTSQRAADPAAARRAASAPAAAGPKAGWYPDPTRRYSHRYWDGGRWTDHVGSNGESSVDPMPASSAVPGPRLSGAPAVTTVSGALSALFGIDQGR
ncbi:MAG: DUF2510 domain-containing protein [Microthrixaceae bacterium]